MLKSAYLIEISFDKQGAVFSSDRVSGFIEPEKMVPFSVQRGLWTVQILWFAV